MSDIVVPGHHRWVPIPLDADPEELNTALLERFGDDDATADAAALLAGTARRLSDANDAADEAGVLNLAAWALVGTPDSLDVRGVATLRAVMVPPETGTEELVRSLVGTEPLFEDPVSAPLDTHSGEAHTVRLRPMSQEESGVPQVHEVAAVLWSRPDLSAAYVLSTYTTDLVEAAEVGDLLEELGAGIEGL